MREYNNYDSKTNDDESDPCIAAAVRMKKSTISAKYVFVDSLGKIFLRFFNHSTVLFLLFVYSALTSKFRLGLEVLIN